MIAPITEACRGLMMPVNNLLYAPLTNSSIEECEIYRDSQGCSGAGTCGKGVPTPFSHFALK